MRARHVQRAAETERLQAVGRGVDQERVDGCGGEGRGVESFCAHAGAAVTSRVHQA
jgi:hypothetical protein